MHTKLYKYKVESMRYVHQSGSIRVPCPPVFFDSVTEEGYIADIQKEAILMGIQPLFLIHKFVNVVSKTGARKIKKRWESFMETNPVAHNTEESSSSRSSDFKSYHLGIWRRSSKTMCATKDTRCKEEHQRVECDEFMRVVEKYISRPVRRLMERYTKDEWAERQR